MKILHVRPSLLALLAALLACLSACTSSSGIFAGGNWQASGLTHSHIRSLVVDSNNPQAIYGGDEQGKIFSSTDGGQHWSEHDTGIPFQDPHTATINSINALSFDATGKRLYAAARNGLFVSTDAAQHWNAVGKHGATLPLDNYTALTIDLNAPHTIYLGTEHHTVLVSTNDGNTWSTIGNDFPKDTVVNSLSFETDNHQLWAATSRGVYHIDVRGTTWQPLDYGLPANILVYTVQLASLSGGTPGFIFAGTSHGFYSSQDYGAHWTQSEESLSRTNVRAILVDFRKPTTLYVGTDAGAFRSDDSGQSWGGIASGLPRYQSVYALALGATDYAQIYAAANDIYLYPGSSNGLTITRLIPILLIVFFFYLLYRLTQRNRTSKQTMLKPERNVEQPSPEQKDGYNLSEPGSLT